MTENRFVRVNSHILNTYVETLKSRKSRRHSFVPKVEGCVTNENPSNYRNVLYLTKSMSKFTMALYFCLIRSIVCQQNCIHEFLFMCRVCPERCIKLLKFSSWEPFVQQLNDAISLINTESKRVLIKTKINVFNQISFMKFNTNFFFGKLPQLIKGCIIIISTHNIIRRNYKI